MGKNTPPLHRFHVDGKPYVVTPKNFLAMVSRVFGSGFGRAASGLMVLSAVTGLLNFASNLIAARALGPTAYASYGTFVALLSMLLIPTAVFLTRAVQVGSISSVSSREMEYLWKTSTRFGWVLAICGVMAIIFVYHGMEHAPITWWMLAGVAALLILAPVEAMSVGILQARRQFVSAQLGRALNGALKTVGLGLLLFWYRKGLESSVFVVVMSLIVSSGYIIHIVKRSRRGRRLGNVIGAVGRRPRSRGRWSLPLAITTGSVLFLNVDMLMAKSIFSAHSAGLFGALTVSGKILALGTGPISVVLYPHVLTSVDTRQTRRLIIGAQAGTLLIGVFILACFWSAGMHITYALFGPSYAKIGPLLVYYGAAFLFYALANVSFTVLLALNAKVLWIDVIGGCVTEVITLLLFRHSLKMFTVALGACMGVIWIASTIQLYPYLKPR